MVDQIIRKVVLLGDGSVGKTSLRRRYMGEGFTRQRIMTIGADFALSDFMFDDYKLTLQIWDIAGQEGFEHTRSRFLRKSSGVLMVFDLTRKHTFENIRTWLEEVFEANDRKDIPIVLIGNKDDLDYQRVIDKKKVNALIKSLKKQNPEMNILDFYETSALTGHNVDKVFETLSKELISE